jgi:putative FmdB family regulatory protein
MPIYEFRCEACDQVFEYLAMRKGDDLEAKCPHCGGEDLSRVMSVAASVVDGSVKPQADSGPQVQNRSCQGSGSCTTFTLPGYGD